MAAHMNRRMIALCTVAVSSIYAAGYLVTNSSAHALNPSSQQQSSGTNSGAPKITPTSAQQTTSSSSSSGTGGSSAASTGSSSSGTGGSSAASSTNSTSGTGSSTTPSKPKYRDGVYHGTGTNPYGTVAVSLTIRGGKIVTVNITSCTTHYPQSFIDPVLPNMVKARQSWRVDIISGATASTYDFATAVYYALQKAKA